MEASLPENSDSFINKIPKDQEHQRCPLKSCHDKYWETIPNSPQASPILPDPINPVSNKNSNCIMDWICYTRRDKDNYKGDGLYLYVITKFIYNKC